MGVSPEVSLVRRWRSEAGDQAVTLVLGDVDSNRRDAKTVISIF